MKTTRTKSKEFTALIKKIKEEWPIRYGELKISSGYSSKGWTILVVSNMPLVRARVPNNCEGYGVWCSDTKWMAK